MSAKSHEREEPRVRRDVRDWRQLRGCSEGRREGGEEGREGWREGREGEDREAEWGRGGEGRPRGTGEGRGWSRGTVRGGHEGRPAVTSRIAYVSTCLLYTSDAADDM
eukprot:2212151-Rhodomonas_salina.1